MHQYRHSYFSLHARTLRLQNSWQEYCIMEKAIISLGMRRTLLLLLWIR